MAKTITGIKAGTTTITATYTDGGVTLSSSVDFTVGKVNATLTFTPVSGTLTYNGSAQTIGKIFYDGDGTVSYAVVKATSQPSVPSSGWTNITSGWTTVTGGKEINISSSSGDAGTYYVFLRATEGTNYNAVTGTAAGNKAISKRTVSVTTAPTFVSSTLTYNGTTNSNGTPQTLVNNNAACGEGGVFYYYVSTSSTAPTSFSTSTWSTSLPTGTNAGDYYVWYYCYVADTTNNTAGTNTNSIKALANSKKNIGRQKTATASASDKTYNGTTNSNGTSQTGVTGEHVSWTGNSTGTNAGSYTAYATPESNFAWLDGTYAQQPITWTMNKRGQGAPTLTGSSVKYESTATLSVTAGKIANGTTNCVGTLTYKYDVNGGTNYTSSTTAPTRTTLGTTKVTAYYAETTNFSASPDATVVNLTVTQNNDATVTVNRNTATLTYDGTAKTLATATDPHGCTYYIGYKKGSAATADTQITWGAANTTPLTAVEAGTYYVYYKWTADANHSNSKSYTAVSGNTVTIGQRTVTITAPTINSTALTYNGNLQTIASGGSCTTGGTMYYFVSTTNTTPSFNASTWTTDLPLTEINAGTYYIWYYCQVSDTSNNTGTGLNTVTSLGSKVVNQKTVSLTFSTPTTWTYDATEKTVTCTVGSLVSGDSCSATITNNTRTNQGSQTVSVTGLSNSNYKLPSSGTTTTLTINKRPINITAASDSKVYDGTALTNNTATAEATGTNRGLVSGHSMTSCTVTGSQTSVGSSSNVPSAAVIKSGNTDVTSNYNITYVNGTLEVTDATITVKTSGQSSVINQSYTYNGSAQGVGLVATTSGGQTATIKYGTTEGTYNTTTVPQITNVSESKTIYYQVTATNHTTVTGSYTLTITKRAISITAPTFVSSTLTYNGNLQTVANTGSASTGGTMYYYISKTNSTPTFNASTWSTTAIEAEDAGTYYVWYYCQADSANNSGSINTVTKLSGSKVINQKTVGLTFSPSPATWTYDGTEKTVTCTATGVETGDTCTVTLSNNKRTVAGSQTVTATAVSNSNYKLPTSGNTATLTINKATLTVTEVNYSGVWDGSNHSSTVTVSNTDWTGKTIVKGDTTSYGTTVTSTGAAGTAYAIHTASAYTASKTVYYKITGDDNYNDYADSITFEITKASAVLPSTWEGDSKSYDDAQVSPAALTYSTPTGGTLKFRYDANGGTNYGSATTTPPTRNTVGTTRVQCMVEGDSNHSSTGWSDAVTLTVYASSDANMTVTLTSRTYTGSAQVIAAGSNLHGVDTYKIGYIKKSIGDDTIPSQPTSDSQLTWAANNSSLSATDAGYYYVYYTFTPGTGHDNSQTREYVGKATIAKANRSGAISCNDTTYPNTVEASLSGNTETGTITWGITAGTGTATIASSTTNKAIVTPTKAGTVTITATVAETANYNAYTATPKQITIGKGTGVITYSVNNSVSDYCTAAAAAASKLSANKTLTITATSASSSTNTGAAITYSIDESGWDISSDGQTITVPANTNAGTYTVNVTATVAATTNYNSASTTNEISVELIAVVLTSLELTLDTYTVAYGSSAHTTSIIATYNNGAFKDVTDNGSTTISAEPDDIVSITG